MQARTMKAEKRDEDYQSRRLNQRTRSGELDSSPGWGSSVRS